MDTTREFHFGDFTLDRSRYRLQRGTHALRLEKLPMELLFLLVERQGDLVSRDEIAERLWGKDVFLDVDHSINVAVRKIRLVLHDDPEKPRFVETVIGRGYRFAAPVTFNGGSHASESPVGVADQPDAGSGENGVATQSRKRPVWLRGAVLFATVIALVVSVLVLMRTVGRSGKTGGRPPIRSLAVLPLRNLSGDPGQEYLADGMTESLIGRLARIHDLRVISRTSVMRFKETQMSVPQIARMLNVDAIIEGSVIREGNQIRVHVQLIRAATDEHIWAEEFQREYSSVLVLEDDLTRSIVSQIAVNLLPGEKVGLALAHPVDPETHEDYLRGRYYFNQRTEDSVNKSIAYFQQAITRDPHYALAYSGLADDYALLGFRGAYPSRQAVAKAKAAALKAIELDDSLAEPHTSLAFIAETHEWDWKTAEREYKRALELNPGDARAHHWYAGYLMYVGRYEEGIAEAERARDLDPLSLPANNALAGRLLVAGRIREALEQVQKTLELDPNFAPAHQTLGWVYLNRGRVEEAVREFQKAVEISGTDDTDLLLDLGFAYAKAGNREEAGKILQTLKTRHVKGLAPAGSIGILYGAMGNLDEAFAWLSKACDERDPELTYLNVPGRRFEPLRHDPRFQQLLVRVGLRE